jgi:hypothetical protein
MHRRADPHVRTKGESPSADLSNILSSLVSMNRLRVDKFCSMSYTYIRIGPDSTEREPTTGQLPSTETEADYPT